MKVFQIVCEGTYAMFSDKHKFMSRKVYTSYPSQQIIEDYKKICTTPKQEGDMFYLDADSEFSIRVNELEIIEN